MENETNNQFQRNDVFSKRIRAGKRRTYFFDVRTTKGNDYYLTITESKKRFHDDGYERHKIFVYKEDFNKFIHTLDEVVRHIKDNLMPDYDFDTYTRDPEDITNGLEPSGESTTYEKHQPLAEAAVSTTTEEADSELLADGSSDSQPAMEDIESSTPQGEVDASGFQETQESSEEEVISWD